jgi:hypothetical protein
VYVMPSRTTTPMRPRVSSPEVIKRASQQLLSL